MDVNWIKITTNMFEDEKIDYIESMPEADTILMIWVRLLTMAGKSNVGGYIMLTEKIPYTDEMLAHKFKRQLNTVKFALQTFAKLDMVVFDETGLRIANWDKHQNVQGLDKIREQNKMRKQKQRLTDKKQLPAVPDDSVTPCHVTVTDESRTLSIIELELDKELDNTSSSGSSVADNEPRIDVPLEKVIVAIVEDEGLAEVMTLYQNNIHPITGGIEADNLTDLVATYSARWVEAAIEEAVKNSVRKLSYIMAILERWRTNGIDEPWLKKKDGKNKQNDIQGEKLQPSAQIAWEEVYSKLIINKQKGIQWSSDFIVQAVKRVGFMNLIQNGAACMPQFVREYNEVTR